jgi:pimeloyl-ACP methyl ester carboxylesterase
MSQEPRLHVTEVGHGPRVVLVHGGDPGGGSTAFDAQKDLERRWTLVMPDRPGHGQTPRDGREDFERDAEVLSPLIAEQPSHLVGHSYGGIVALYMAARQPDSVRSLVLIEPPAFWFAPDDPAVAEMARNNRELFENPPDDPVEMIKRFFALVGMDFPLPDDLPMPRPQPLVDIAKVLGDIRGPDEGSIAVGSLIAGAYPILVLTSGRIAGFEGIAEAIAAQTGGEHIVIPGTDHAVQKNGDAVNPLLERFWLKGAESPTSRDNGPR